MRAFVPLTFAVVAGGSLFAQAVPDEGVVRLVAHDDLRRTFGFTTWDYGQVIHRGIVHNRNSQLALGKDAEGADVLRLGWQGGEKGVCLDLGVLRDKATLSSLFWRLDRREAVQRLAGQTMPRPAAVKLDHVYVGRIEGVAVAGAGIAKGDTMYVRLHVLDHEPGRYVELRYTILREQKGESVAGSGGEAPAWTRSEVRTAEQVFDPGSLPPAQWPGYVTAAERDRVAVLVEAVAKGKEAESKELVSMGHKALAGILNRLREIDYLDADEAWSAWQLNRVLEEMTVGMNTGYVPVRPGERVDPRKADWNAKTAKAWQKLLTLYPTAEAWERLVAKRRARQGR